jgi:UDP-2,3-diacylglucosamine pyrophosphatase LpxH
VGRRTALAVHGDALTDTRPMSRALNRVLAAPVTTTLFRQLHPDTAFRLVQRVLDPMLGDEPMDGPRLAASARRQLEWAEARFAAEPALGMLLMAHTHQPAVHELPDGRRYLNLVRRVPLRRGHRHERGAPPVHALTGFSRGGRRPPPAAGPR